ncbi:hypothetical protein [Roseobacter litoralis]|uniref:hypothetical protein n=1 Tax=Roseobacter litoralis TaxID=42443 RepID=UPI0024953C35|nr:hypothetical protein [Roseobacter litoralis]
MGDVPRVGQPAQSVALVLSRSAGHNCDVGVSQVQKTAMKICYSFKMLEGRDG